MMKKHDYFIISNDIIIKSEKHGLKYDVFFMFYVFNLNKCFRNILTANSFWVRNDGTKACGVFFKIKYAWIH